jgi:hypothetical protein
MCFVWQSSVRFAPGQYLCMYCYSGCASGVWNKWDYIWGIPNMSEVRALAARHWSRHWHQGWKKWCWKIFEDSTHGELSLYLHVCWRARCRPVFTCLCTYSAPAYCRFIVCWLLHAWRAECVYACVAELYMPLRVSSRMKSSESYLPLWACIKSQVYVHAKLCISESICLHWLVSSAQLRSICVYIELRVYLHVSSFLESSWSWVCACMPLCVWRSERHCICMCWAQVKCVFTCLYKHGELSVYLRVLHV